MAQASAGISGDAGARAGSIVRSAAIGLWLVLIALDFFIPDPITFAWRQVFALALTAGGLAACIAFLFAGHRVLAVLFAAAAALALWQDAQPWFAKAAGSCAHRRGCHRCRAPLCHWIHRCRDHLGARSGQPYRRPLPCTPQRRSPRCGRGGSGDRRPVELAACLRLAAADRCRRSGRRTSFSSLAAAAASAGPLYDCRTAARPAI